MSPYGKPYENGWKMAEQDGYPVTALAGQKRNHAPGMATYRCRDEVEHCARISQGQSGRENLRAALSKNSIRRGHLKALPHTEVGAAIAKIRASQAFWSAKACFEFLTLTITRSGEARLATWDEIDLETMTWTIPAERMKAKRAHRVPLSDQVFEILLDARERTGGAGLIFPAKTGKAMSDSTISKLVRENGIGCVPHGMRSSAREWMAEVSDAPHEVCELALAYVNTNRVEAAYR